MQLPPSTLRIYYSHRMSCQKLNQQDAEELKADINRVLRSSHPMLNLIKAEQAIRELKRDKSRIILTVDKGIIMVIMDRQEYIDKANNLLVSQPTDPSPRILPTK